MFKQGKQRQSIRKLSLLAVDGDSHSSSLFFPTDSVADLVRKRAGRCPNAQFGPSGREGRQRQTKIDPPTAVRHALNLDGGRADRMQAHFDPDVCQGLPARTGLDLDLEQRLGRAKAAHRIQKQDLNSSRGSRSGRNGATADSLDNRTVLGFQQAAYVVGGKTRSFQKMPVGFHRLGQDSATHIDDGINKGVTGSVILGLYVVGHIAHLHGSIESKDPRRRRLLHHYFLCSRAGKTLNKSNGRDIVNF